MNITLLLPQNNARKNILKKMRSVKDIHTFAIICSLSILIKAKRRSVAFTLYLCEKRSDVAVPLGRKARR